MINNFYKYLKKNFSLVILSTIIVLAIYIVRLVNYDIGADTVGYMSGIKKYLYMDYLQRGRWTKLLLMKILINGNINFYFANYVSIIFLILSNFSWLFIYEDKLKLSFNKNIPIAKIIFSLVYLSSIVWVELFYFTLQNIECFFMIMICPFTIKYFIDNYKKQIALFMSSILLLLMLTTYQAIVTMYIAGFLLYLAADKDRDFKSYVIMLMHTIIMFVISFILYLILDKIILYVFDTEKSNYLSNMLYLDHLVNPSLLIKKIIRLTERITIFFIGNVPILSDILYKFVSKFIELSPEIIHQFQSTYFMDQFNMNIFSLIIIFIFLIKSKAKWTKYFIFILTIIVAFLLNILGRPPIRAMYQMPIIWAFISLYATLCILDMNIKIGYTFIVFSLIFGLYKIEYDARLNMSDHLRFENDKRIVENICHDLDKIRTKDESKYYIYLIGQVDNPYNYGFISGQSIGISIFSQHFSPTWQQSTNYGQPFFLCLGHNYKPLDNPKQCIEILKESVDMPSYPYDGYIQLIDDDIFVIKLSNCREDINEIENMIRK